MSEKLTKEELLEWLEEYVDRFSFLQVSHPHLSKPPSKKDIKAYTQLKEIVEWYYQHREDYEALLRFQTQIQQLEKQQKPEKIKVSREWVEKTIRDIEYALEPIHAEMILEERLLDYGIKMENPRMSVEVEDGCRK